MRPSNRLISLNTLVVAILSLFPLLSAAGSVRNNTPWTLSYTRDPNSPAAPHWCQFWNWWTPPIPIPRRERLRCTHIQLGGNGGRSTGDVDGFTFADRDYSINDAIVRRGEWTKIIDIRSVICEDYFGRAICVG